MFYFKCIVFPFVKKTLFVKQQNTRLFYRSVCMIYVYKCDEKEHTVCHLVYRLFKYYCAENIVTCKIARLASIIVHLAFGFRRK